MVSVCHIDNMNSNETIKTRTGPKWVHTQEPEAEPETPPTPPRSTHGSPTKGATDALQLAVASLPTSLQPQILHFGNRTVTARCKRYKKVNHATNGKGYKLCSTLHQGNRFQYHSVDWCKGGLRESVLPRATDKTSKDSYESSLKNVIEECIALEIQAAKKEESQLIMDLFPAIGKAIQQLQGTECSEHLQTVKALKMMPTLLQYGPIANIINFLHLYQTHHTLEEIPKPTVRTMPLQPRPTLNYTLNKN